jgi:modulator of FtsH protease HflK
MRTDHLAYQQATRVAGMGFLLQAAIGLIMLVYGFIFKDSAFQVASEPILVGTLVWIALVVVFHQHRLDRLEALERDDLAAERGEEVGGIFEEGETDVAARRLRLMHIWLMPIASLLVAGLLVFFGLRTLRWFEWQNDPELSVTPFQVGGHLGWQLAIALALALFAFIFSRFVAGMAARPAWGNLRGGAGHMVGNALVLLAVAVGIAFRFFESPAVLEGVTWGLAIYMLLVAAEIVLNFILNLYRPRRPGEVPRPAFDSRVLSLFAAPDSIVRSINEAVNYQFGFDITSSWGYQLLLRSFAWLLAFAFVVLIGLSTVVIVEPGQQAVRLRGGRIVGPVYEGSTMFKWPWPLETVTIVDSARVRELSLNGTPREVKETDLWDPAEEPINELFLVSANPLPEEVTRSVDQLEIAQDRRDEAAGFSASTEPTQAVTNQFALLDVDVILSYRVKSGALVDYLNFSNDVKLKRSALDMRQQALQEIALRVVTQTFSQMPLEDVLSPQGSVLATELRQRIQTEFDAVNTGVDVVSIAIPALRPPGDSVSMFEELAIDTQNVRKLLEEARRTANAALAGLVGDSDRALEIVSLIERYRSVERADGPDAQTTIDARIEAERMVRESQGFIASFIASARSLRWKIHMDARRNAAEVLGQVGAYETAPELYQERRVMEILREVLQSVRSKYVLAVDPSRTDLDIEMQEPDAGLNLRDYLEDPAEGN